MPVTEMECTSQLVQECEKNTEDECENVVEDLECIVSDDGCKSEETVCQQVVKPVCVIKTAECSKVINNEVNKNDNQDQLEPDLEISVDLNESERAAIIEDMRVEDKKLGDDKENLQTTIAQSNGKTSVEVIIDGVASMFVELDSTLEIRNKIKISSSEDIFLATSIIQEVVEDMREERTKRQTSTVGDCTPESEEECRDVMVEECSVTCSDKKISAKCRDLRTEWLDALLCKSVPRTHCKERTVQSCSVVPGQRCETVRRERCEKNTGKVCKKKECGVKPKQFCQSVPRTECRVGRKKCTVSPHGKCEYDSQQCGCEQGWREECRTVQKKVCGQEDGPVCEYQCREVYWCPVCHKMQ